MPHVYDEVTNKRIQVHAKKLEQRPSKCVQKRQRYNEHLKYLLRLEKDTARAAELRQQRKVATSTMYSTLQLTHLVDAEPDVTLAPIRAPMGDGDGALQLTHSYPDTEPELTLAPVMTPTDDGISPKRSFGMWSSAALEGTPTPIRALLSPRSGTRTPRSARVSLSALKEQCVYANPEGTLFESMPTSSGANACYGSPEQQRPERQRRLSGVFQNSPARSAADAHYGSPVKRHERGEFESQPAVSHADAHYASPQQSQFAGVFESTPSPSKADVQHAVPASWQQATSDRRPNILRASRRTSM